MGKTAKIFVSSEWSHVRLFCKKPQEKVRRHQTRQHKSESQVAKAMAMETAQEPDLAFEKLRLLGDYQHNCDVLDLGEGELIVVRMPKEVEEGIAANFLPCPSCMGFFMASELWRHPQNCPQRSQENPPKWWTVQQEAKLLLPTTVFLPTKDVKRASITSSFPL